MGILFALLGFLLLKSLFEEWSHHRVALRIKCVYAVCGMAATVTSLTYFGSSYKEFRRG
jgi:hypothetical protein